MALGFEVHGPTQVLFNNSAEATPSAVLGYTDNNDLISLELEYPQEPIYTTRLGSIPEAFIHLGLIGRLSMTLVKWDSDLLDTLSVALPGGATAASDVGTIGGIKSTGDGNFSLQIAGASSGIEYTMKNCYLDGPIRRLDFGNKPSRIGLNFICLPLATGDDDAMLETDSVYEVS